MAKNNTNNINLSNSLAFGRRENPIAGPGSPGLQVKQLHGHSNWPACSGVIVR